MSIHARVMTLSRAHWLVALRVASPPRQESPFQEPARWLNRRPASRYAANKLLARRGSNVAYPNSVNKP
jgi:hypothetical protein